MEIIGYDGHPTKTKQNKVGATNGALNISVKGNTQANGSGDDHHLHIDSNGNARVSMVSTVSVAPANSSNGLMTPTHSFNTTTKMSTTQLETNRSILAGANHTTDSYTKKHNGKFTFGITADGTFTLSAVVVYASYDNVNFFAIHSSQYEVNSYNALLRVVAVKEEIIAPYWKIKVENNTADTRIINIFVSE
jgi:hypothetical protein